MESKVFWLLSQLNTFYSESFSYRLWGFLLQGGEYSLAFIFSCRSPASVGVVPSRVRFDLPDGLPGVFYSGCRLCLSISFWVRCSWGWGLPDGRRVAASGVLACAIWGAVAPCLFGCIVPDGLCLLQFLAMNLRV